MVITPSANAPHEAPEGHRATSPSSSSISEPLDQGSSVAVPSLNAPDDSLGLASQPALSPTPAHYHKTLHVPSSAFTSEVLLQIYPSCASHLIIQLQDNNPQKQKEGLRFGHSSY
ncbi:hypothetical protein K1719_029292 [Acacia pycnantha]|nr:hypothetical protein K1719_029292 [Acacia pycnantha]